MYPGHPERREQRPLCHCMWYACQFQQLILMRMYSAGRQQPQQVGRAAFRQRCDEVVQGCVAGQQTVFIADRCAEYPG